MVTCDGVRPSEAEIRRALGELLSPGDIDRLMGWTRGTATKSRRRPNGLPAPDAHVGSTPVWFRATFERWLATRPGQGAGGGRPRLANPSPATLERRARLQRARGSVPDAVWPTAE